MFQTGSYIEMNNIQVFNRYIEMKIARAVTEANCKSETSVLVVQYAPQL